MEKKKKSLIEELKTDTITFKNWYKYAYLYESLVKRLSINEALTFITSLINSNVVLSTKNEISIYNGMTKRLKYDFEAINSLKEIIISSKTNQKTK